MPTNVPPISFTNIGITLPAESDIVSGVLADQNAAFGGDLNLSLETPQGQLATSTAAVIADKNSQIAFMANQTDPAYSSGRWQDGVGRIYFMTRIAGQGTVVVATCGGSAGVVIPSGAMAKDIAGNIYTSNADGIIETGGTVEISFTCSSLGPIACPSANLTTIYQSVPGWDSITNAAAGVLGRLAETRADFEYRRKNSVAVNAQGVVGAIRGAVMAVTGVTDTYVIENTTATAVAVGETSYSVAANSVYVAVVGGASADIARAIWLKKSAGCAMNGATTVTVYDTDYDAPQPSYTIKYEIPSALPVLFAVSIQNNANLPANIATLIKAAIVAAFTGADGGTRARIGAQLVAGRFYSGVAATSPYVNILSILMGTATATLTSVTPGIDEVPTIQDSNITVTLV